MSNPLRVLAARPLDGVFRLASRPNEESLTGDDPATQVLKDFTSHNPLTIRSAMGIQEVKEKLYTAGVMFSVVINRNDEVVGMLPLKDLIGTWPLSLANQRGSSITDITAQDVMRPVWSLPAIRHGQLQDLKIDQLVDLFNELHTDYLLVTDASAAGVSERFVRGLLSADDLTQQLGIHLNQDPRPESFSDIVHAVRGKSG
ncbi:CBS domain-containing protein [Marinobacter changyiensis]|uniref:CBS domain-containing protein n=1 Tax=Marinobacter changyiensis TaxID=2604091 RepID=UPI0012646DB9|nr:CBS domain-containing protein [Marinobacter changyiensis]